MLILILIRAKEVGFSLITSYPLWLLVFCISAGAIAAALLYFRNRNDDFSPLTRKILALLRGTLVFLVSFLLLSPFVSTLSRHKEKPIIIVALDNSGSIIAGKDSIYYKEQFADDVNKFSRSLDEKFDIQMYTFGEKVKTGFGSLHFDEKLTNFSSLFSEIKDRYSNRNVAAMVLTSDGIYNDGADPVYTAEDVPYYIYTVALGDTTQHKDVFINRVNYNQIAFLGNDFPVEVNVAAFKSAGSNLKLAISSENKDLFTESFQVTSNEFNKTISTRLSASKLGIQRYKVVVSSIEGEVSTKNNIQDFFVEVMDSRQKILLLFSSPHPDVAALKQSIEKSNNYTVESSLLSDFHGSIASYNLLILHQIPAVSDVGFAITSQVTNSSIPILYILGSQSNLSAYNSLQAGLLMPSNGNQTLNEATPVLADDFNFFALSPEMEQMIPEFSPLSVPFGQYKTGTAASVLMYQKIGSLSTKIPLIVFNHGVDRKSATITGEGIWRWRLINYAKKGNQLAFDELISKMVQYLSVKEDKSKFRLIMNNHFYENEPIQVNAELYNDSYVLVNEPDVTIEISDSAKHIYPFTFTRTSQAYYLDAGSLPPGDYSYKATTTFAGKTVQKTGLFTVVPLHVEWTNTVANHGMLANLSGLHNGKMVKPNQLEELSQMINQREDFKTIVYSQKKFTELVSFFPFLIMLFLLLSAEWYIRKRNGSY